MLPEEDTGVQVAGRSMDGVFRTAGDESSNDQVRTLNESIGASGARAVMRGQVIVVTLPEAMLFEPGSAMVKNSALDWISAVSRSLQDYPASRASIRGFTDNTGVPAEAQRLSEDRARAVTRVLIATGTNSSRLTYAGVGAGNPVASNTTEAGRNQNRRIEVIISPEV